MTHTPLECIGTDNGEYVISRRYPTGKRRTVAHVYEKGLQDTIVTAVNQHEALKAENDRLRAAVDEWQKVHDALIDVLEGRKTRNKHTLVRAVQAALAGKERP